MHNEQSLILMNYRLEQAHICLSSAIREIEADDYKTAANRSYYCIFHAMRAVLALEGFDSKRHSGIISVFRQKYIKCAIFPHAFSDIIRDAFNNRGKSDYEDFFVISKEETARQIKDAAVFLSAMEDYLKTIT